MNKIKLFFSITCGTRSSQCFGVKPHGGLFSNVHFTNCLTNNMLSNHPFSVPYLFSTCCEFFEGKLTKYFSSLTTGKQRIKIIDIRCCNCVLISLLNITQTCINQLTFNFMVHDSKLFKSITVKSYWHLPSNSFPILS